MYRPCPLHSGWTAKGAVGAPGALALPIEFSVPCANMLHSISGRICDVIHKASRNEAPRNSKSNSKVRHSRVVMHCNSPDAAQSRRANRSDGCRLLEVKPAPAGGHTHPRMYECTP